MAEHNNLGKIGETIAATFLVKCGFTIIDRNYRTKYGELDIIAQKDKTIHCIEVKSSKVFSLETIQTLLIRPEDNFTREKRRKVITTFMIYLKEKDLSHIQHQIDLACVYIDLEKREGRVKLIKNV